MGILTTTENPTAMLALIDSSLKGSRPFPQLTSLTVTPAFALSFPVRTLASGWNAQRGATPEQSTGLDAQWRFSGASGRV
jgi:hypothetical protein